jgi:excisionase family DNA binding protein
MRATHFSVSQAARFSALSEATIRMAIQHGRLEVERSPGSRRLRITRAALDAYLSSR